MSKPRLISFKLCPFVQRSVILLKEKGVEYDIEYIDVYDPPEWFLELSPTGKVPVMQVGDMVLFESAVINEYIDEVYSPQLHPSDPLQKAQNRAWIEYTSPLYMGTFNLLMAKSEGNANKVIEEIRSNLDGLEQAKNGDGWFNGEDFSLVDISVAPFFLRAKFFKEHFQVDLLDGFENLQTWSDKILPRPTVKASIVNGYEDMLVNRMKSNESYLQSA